MKKSVFVFLFSLILMCTQQQPAQAGFFDVFKSNYKEGVVVDGRLSKEKVADVAQKSENMPAFLRNIFEQTIKVSASGHQHTIDSNFVSKNEDPMGLFAADAYGIYCRSKNGELYKWDVISSMSVLGRGTFPVGANYVISCESSSGVESAMLDFVGGQGNQKEHVLAFVDKVGLDEHLAKIRPNIGFANDDKSVVLFIPTAVGRGKNLPAHIASRIPPPQDYHVKIVAKNKTNQPVNINFTDVKLKVGSVLYNGYLNCGDSGRSRGCWSKYPGNYRVPTDWYNGKGPLVLNPGGEFSGILKVKIPDVNLETFETERKALVMDGKQFELVQKISSYDANKEKIDMQSF